MIFGQSRALPHLPAHRCGGELGRALPKVGTGLPRRVRSPPSSGSLEKGRCPGGTTPACSPVTRRATPRPQGSLSCRLQGRESQLLEGDKARLRKQNKQENLIGQCNKSLGSAPEFPGWYVTHVSQRVFCGTPAPHFEK